jgi:hypothetical protein
MTTRLQEPRLQRTESPAPCARLAPRRTSASPRPPVETVLLATPRPACEQALGLLLGIVILVLQFAGCAAFVLAAPLAPFPPPRLLLPVILAFDPVILGAGAVLGAIGRGGCEAPAPARHE